MAIAEEESRRRAGLVRFVVALTVVAGAVGVAQEIGWAQAPKTRYGIHRPKSAQQPKTTSAQEERSDPSGAMTPTRVRQTTTETPTGQIQTQVFENPSINGGYEARAEVEEETIKVDAQTTRVVRRLYGRDPDGGRRVIEVTEEVHRQLPNDGERIIRTTTHPDVNGRFRTTREETVETTRLDPQTIETRTSVRQPGINGGLALTEQSTETKRATEPGVEVVEKTRQLPDGNGRLEAFETRVRTVRTDEKQTRSEEEVYRRDANQKLSLAEKTVSREWQDAQGADHQTVEKYSVNIARTTRYANGRLNLDSKAETVRRTLPDGSQETVQEVQERSLVAPEEGLRPAHKVVEFSRPVGTNQLETTRTVQVRDANGRYQNVIVLQGREPAKPVAEKPEEEEKEESKSESEEAPAP